ncbi:MAG TPA: class I SAM-dependent methyltransferase [Thermoanaerobaculia bacterium]
MQPTRDDDPLCDFYDSDTPSEGPIVAFYRSIAAEAAGKPVLVLCCGTGRIALALLADGHTVTAADISSPMLAKFRDKLPGLSNDARQRLTIVHADASELSFREAFGAVIIPYNSIPCIPSFDGQLRTLRNAFAALTPNGVFAADLVNALIVRRKALLEPQLMYTRRHVIRGTEYSRFGMHSALDADQIHRAFGYYDELQPDGTHVRHDWEETLRHVFRFELELMLRLSGFDQIDTWGGFDRKSLQARDPKIVVRAMKRIK